jgi:hypothetical protein
MTFYEPNPEVRDTGAEAGEFLDDGPQSVTEDDDGDDPTERRSGTRPLEPG